MVVLALPMWMYVGSVFAHVASSLAYSFDGFLGASRDPDLVVTPLLSPSGWVGLLVLVLYEPVMVALWGATVGKLAVGIRVVSVCDGAGASAGSSWLRAALPSAAGVATLGVGWCRLRVAVRPRVCAARESKRRAGTRLCAAGPQRRRLGRQSSRHRGRAFKRATDANAGNAAACCPRPRDRMAPTSWALGPMSSSDRSGEVRLGNGRSASSTHRLRRARPVTGETSQEALWRSRRTRRNCSARKGSAGPTWVRRSARGGS